jgi:hypothetical protein
MRARSECGLTAFAKDLAREWYNFKNLSRFTPIITLDLSL